MVEIIIIVVVVVIVIVVVVVAIVKKAYDMKEANRTHVGSNVSWYVTFQIMASSTFSLYLFRLNQPCFLLAL